MGATPCQSDAELFFRTNPKEVRAAKELCSACPLERRDACEVEGWNHEYGVFGGLSPIDRKRIDPDRYREAVAGVKDFSEQLDRSIVERRAERERERVAA